MNDLPAVRAEIKSWERSFRESNGRPPTVEDIKQNDIIANKYKLYKKLGKEAANSNSTQPGPPSTPPRVTRTKIPSSSLLSRTRTVESTAPLSTFNPFSPQKNGKTKRRSIIQPKLVLNSDLSPKAQPIRTTIGMTDPFDPRNDSQPSSSTPDPSHLDLPLAPNTAVSRARKRLRGEPVSPSPNKVKRRRTTPQTTLPLPRLNMEAQSSDEDDYPQEAQTSFVDSSPMKPSTAGRSFSLLFEESAVPVSNLFGSKADSRTLNFEMDIHPPKKPSKSRNNSNQPTYKLDFSKAAAGKSGELLVTDLGCEKKPPVLNTALIITSDQSVSSPRSSMKRPSDEEMERFESQSFNRPKSPLIPPSPPPASRNPANTQSKTNARAKKRAKVDNDKDNAKDDNGTHDLDSKAKLKIVNRSGTRVPHAAEVDDSILDIDPIIGYPRFVVPRDSLPPHQQDDGSIEIDLPDKLRRVLALPSSSQNQVLEEDRLIKHLFYGRRVAHYDPKKGGEIWDVGEDDTISDEQRRTFTEGEDDWEGEPVPWEVGEL